MSSWLRARPRSRSCGRPRRPCPSCSPRAAIRSRSDSSRACHGQGGNVTGVSSVGADLSTKYIEFLRIAIPALSTVAVLMNPGHPGHPDYLRNIRTAAREAVQVLPLHAANADQIQDAFGVIRQRRAGALIVLGDGLFFSQARRIAELAVQQRLPTLFSTREPVQVGGLMSYGPNLAEQFYRAATYVDKILRGARPAELPVEQPTTFELGHQPPHGPSDRTESASGAAAAR
jgi:putative ABC transport system substrate-binding protein